LKNEVNAPKRAEKNRTQKIELPNTNIKVKKYTIWTNTFSSLIGYFLLEKLIKEFVFYAKKDV
jgi:hypothetical protein